MQSPKRTYNPTPPISGAETRTDVRFSLFGNVRRFVKRYTDIQNRIDHYTY